MGGWQNWQQKQGKSYTSIALACHPHHPDTTLRGPFTRTHTRTHTHTHLLLPAPQPPPSEDLLERVNAALHAAFDRPDVPLEAPPPPPGSTEGLAAPEGAADGRQVLEGKVAGAAAGAGTGGNGGNGLRSVDRLRDQLVDQVGYFALVLCRCVVAVLLLCCRCALCVLRVAGRAGGAHLG